MPSVHALLRARMPHHLLSMQSPLSTLFAFPCALGAGDAAELEQSRARLRGTAAAHQALTGGKTWALWCPNCPREVIVDVIGLLERHDLYDAVRLDKAVCNGCGDRLKQSGGYEINALQFRKRMPKLITSDRSSWWRPIF